MRRLPRFARGEMLSAEKINKIVEAIERAINITFKGAIADIDSQAGRVVVLNNGSGSGTPIMIAQTVGRHDLGSIQPVNLYTQTDEGEPVLQMDGASNPVTVNAVNMIANLAGGVYVYIADTIGTQTLWDIISGDPCLQGNTGGPSS